jgi:hypothetical protein
MEKTDNTTIMFLMTFVGILLFTALLCLMLP